MDVRCPLGDGGGQQLIDVLALGQAALRRLVQVQLWDPAAQFFKVRLENGTFSDAREAIGFLPWYVELPGRGRGFEGAWAQFTDEAGFRAPFGVTTAL